MKKSMLNNVEKVSFTCLFYSSNTPIFANSILSYQGKEGKYLAKQEITKRAAELWFKIKNDKNEVQRYIELSSSNKLSSLYLIMEPRYIVTKE